MTDTPHDALFQYTFAKVEHAAPALRAMLPAALSAQIDFSTLHRLPESFVDPQLDGRRADLLFSVIIAGRSSFIYVLFEHQSYQDRLLFLRLLEYMTRIWRAYLGQHPKAKRLPPIVPVILHHSKTGWRTARRFEQLLDWNEGIREALAEFVPRFGIVLDDISAADDAELSKRARTALDRLVLNLFRYARTPDELLEKLGQWHETLLEVLQAPEGGDAIWAVVRYLVRVTKRDEPEVIMAVRKAIEMDEDAVAAREIRMGAGWLEVHGERKLLLRQLRFRFGELPASAVARVEASFSEELQAMAERILTAKTLDEVLGKPAPKRRARRG